MKNSLSKLKECKGKNCSGLEGGLKRQTKKDYRFRYREIRKELSKRYATLLEPVRTVESVAQY